MGQAAPALSKLWIFLYSFIIHPSIHLSIHLFPAQMLLLRVLTLLLYLVWHPYSTLFFFLIMSSYLTLIT